MRATIQEAFEAYVAELTRYREWMDTTKGAYSGLGSNNNHMNWDRHDYRKCETWNAELKAVRDNLSLTPEEDAEADRRAGIKSC